MAEATSKARAVVAVLAALVVTVLLGGWAAMIALGILGGSLSYLESVAVAFLARMVLAPSPRVNRS